MNEQKITQPDIGVLRKVYERRKFTKKCASILAYLVITTSIMMPGAKQDVRFVAGNTIDREVKSDSVVISSAEPEEVVEVVEPVKPIVQPKVVVVDAPKEIVVSSDATVEAISLGQFKISAYCHCSQCCGKSDGITATGTMVQANRTIAVDPRTIPLGSKVMIDGQIYVAEDTGGAIKGNRIDMYFATHQDALNFGIQYKNVSLITTA